MELSTLTGPLAPVYVSPPRKEHTHGSDLSPAQSPTREQARLPRADENEVGTCRPVTPPEKGAQAPRGSHSIQTLEQVTRERFPRRARLSDVQACWDAGQRRRTRFLEVAWRPSHSARARTAIVVPRFQHTAVARNRLRRRLRELLRRGPLATLPPVDLVLRARRTAYDATFAALRAELTASVREIT